MEKAWVNGVEIAYEIAGDTGEAVVFLNGIAMSIAHWASFAAELSDRYRVLSHDFRGQLLSGRPEGRYSLQDHVEDLKALMDHLGIRKAHVAGISYGAAVALLFALSYPEAASSLVVMDGARSIDPLLRASVVGWREAALAGPRAFYRNLIPWTYSSSFIASHEEFFDQREGAIASFPRDYFTSFAALCDAFLGLDVEGRIDRITCPALVLYGERDLLVPGHAQRLAAAIPNSRLEVVPGAGHASAVEQPETMARSIARFLDALPR
jgi:Predicted hydrolases or acyltransferases (alpha/beta hydrolase superfamily)